MKYSLYIPAYNAAPFLDRCLQAVLGQKLPPRQVVVVDDGSTDATAAIASRYPVRLIRHPRNLGLAAARNTGWQHCPDEIIGAIDADCCPGPLWAATLLPHFANPRVGGAGGRLYEAVQISRADHWRDAHMRQQWGEAQTIIRNPLLLSGNNTLFRAAALAQGDGYDESPRYRTNNEDLYISQQLKSAGWDILHDPAARVDHLRHDNLHSIYFTYWKWFEHQYSTLNTPRNLLAKQYQNLLRCREFLLASRRRRDFDTMPFDFLFVPYQLYFDLRAFTGLVLRPAVRRAGFRLFRRLLPVLPPAWWLPVSPFTRRYNALLATAAQQQRATRLVSLPVKITVLPASCGKHSCALQHQPQDPAGLRRDREQCDGGISPSLFVRLAAEAFPFASTVCLAAYGKTMLSPRLKEATAICVRYGVRLELITDFAVPLTARQLDPLLAVTANLRLNIDGSDALPGKHLHRDMPRSTLARNLALFNRLRAGGRYPQLRAGLVMFLRHDHLAELPILVRQARDWKLDYLHIPQFVLAAVPESARDSAAWRDETSSILAETGRLAGRLALEVMLPPPATVPGRQCPLRYHELFVSDDGAVRSCPLLNLPPLGNIRNDSIVRLWTKPNRLSGDAACSGDAAGRSLPSCK